MLASASSARRDVLSGAGIQFTVDPADVDEAGFKDNHGGTAPDEIARQLAKKKALVVSNRRPDALVIGADQTMECDGVSYDKPQDRAAARTHLQSLRGRTHVLNSAVCVARGGKVLWSTTEPARLTMRDFDDTFLEDYLTEAGDDVLTSVGCYRLEGLGAHLFEAIDGDFFTILGLPLLPLLTFLRDSEFLH